MGLPTRGSTKMSVRGLVEVSGLPYPRGVRLSAFPRERTWCDPGWRAGFIVGCFAPVPPRRRRLGARVSRALFGRSTL